MSTASSQPGLAPPEEPPPPPPSSLPLPPMPSRDAMRLPLLADAAMAVAVNGAASSTSVSSAAAAAPTLTTPTLTPTTLRNIEQMFLDTESQGGPGPDELRPPDTHENSARFEPPQVSIEEEPSTLQQPPPPPPSTLPPPLLPPYGGSVKVEEAAWVADGSVLPGPHSNEKTSSSPVAHLPVVPAPSVELPTVPLRLLPTEPVPCALIKESEIATSAPASVVLNPAPPPALSLVMAAATTISLPTQPVNGILLSKETGSGSRRKKSSSTTSSAGGNRGRRPKSSASNLSPEEEHKKILRRQRNKEAAARCRKRRLDQTVSLQEEVDQWEAKKAETEEEIRALERQKVDLEALLAAHRGECKVALVKAGQGQVHQQQPEKRPRRKATKGSGKKSSVEGGAPSNLTKDIGGKSEESSNT